MRKWLLLLPQGATTKPAEGSVNENNDGKGPIPCLPSTQLPHAYGHLLHVPEGATTKPEEGSINGIGDNKGTVFGIPSTQLPYAYWHLLYVPQGATPKPAEGSVNKNDEEEGPHIWLTFHIASSCTNLLRLPQGAKPRPEGGSTRAPYHAYLPRSFLERTIICCICHRVGYPGRQGVQSRRTMMTRGSRVWLTFHAAASCARAADSVLFVTGCDDQAGRGVDQRER